MSASIIKGDMVDFASQMLQLAVHFHPGNENVLKTGTKYIDQSSVSGGFVSPPNRRFCLHLNIIWSTPYVGTPPISPKKQARKKGK